MAEPYRINLNGGRERRIPRLVPYLVLIAIWLPLMVFLKWAFPGAYEMLDVGIKVVVGVLLLRLALGLRQQPMPGRRIPLWLQCAVLGVAMLALAALTARDALG